MITGATGLVGSALVAELRQAGVSIHYLTTSRDKIQKEPGYEGFYWDPSANQIDVACFEGVTHMVNLAGATIAKRWTPAHKNRVQKSREDSLYTLKTGLASLEDHSVEYLASASATGIYPSSQTEFYTEDHGEPDTGFLGETVQRWEAAAVEFKPLNIPVGIFRIGLVLSGEGGALPEIMRPVRFGVGAPLGNGQQWQSWIHFKDLARMLRFGLEEQLEGTFNAVAPNPVTNEKLTREVARILGKPLWLPKVPAWALRLALGEMSQLLLASQRVSCERIEMEGFNFHFSNVHQALEDLLD